MKPMLKRKIRRFGCFFAISFTVCILVTVAYIQNRSQLESSQMEQLAMAKSNKVSNVLEKLLYKTQILAAFVQQSNGQIENFEQVASTIVDDSCIKNVLLAPDGVVRHVYPEAGNEAAFGLDFSSDKEGNTEADLAKKAGQLVLGGPFNLVQGGQALVGRLPVYMEKDGEQEFWGIASVTLNYPQALDGAELEQLQNQGFAFEIWRISPDTGERQTIAKSEYSYDGHAKYVEYPMEILNAEWFFRLSPIRNWYQFPETWIFLSIGFVISLLIGFLMLHNLDLSVMKKELEEISLKDPLTGILNRRGCFQCLEELTAGTKRPFLLCYMDLNLFKSINDKFGHNAGDKVLKNFAGEFSRIMDPKRHVFSRIGGDEFILIMKGTDNREDVEALCSEGAKYFEQNGIQVHGETIFLTFSMGLAEYPGDGVNVDDLIAFADSNMYLAKRSNQER